MLCVGGDSLNEQFANMVSIDTQLAFDECSLTQVALDRKSRHYNRHSRPVSSSLGWVCSLIRPPMN